MKLLVEYEQAAQSRCDDLGALKPQIPHMVSSIGVDLVYLPDFIAQLRQPGSTFGKVFSAAEMRLAKRRSMATGRLPEYHLAARFAGKEAFIKAWSSALFGKPPVIAPAEVVFAQIEVLSDAYGRVQLNLSGKIRELFFASIGEHFANNSGVKKAECNSCENETQLAVNLSISLSHDGDYALAYVHLYAFER